MLEHWDNMKTIGIASHYIRQHPGIQSVVASFEEGGGHAQALSVLRM